MNQISLALEIENEIRSIPVQDISFGLLDHSQLREEKIKQVIINKSLPLETQEKERLSNEFLGTGPLQLLIEDEDITEIIVNSARSIWFEKNGRLQKNDDFFISEFTFQNFIERLCQESNSHFNLERPMANGKFRDFRLHLMSSEITQNSHAICLRRHPKNPWTIAKLLEKKWCKKEEAEKIIQIVQSKENFLVVGATGSGKTSLLNACLQLLKENERAILIEDTPELSVPNAVSNKLITRFDSNGLLSPIDQTELVKQSLRMRPDRLVMGEIRGAEAKDLLMALSTGHGGSFGTLHASTASQALLRLEMLIQLGAPYWGLSAIRNLIFLSLKYIIVVGRNPEGQRDLQGVFQLSSLEESGFLLDRLF